MEAPADLTAGGTAYRRLFGANALALVSTGVATVALALLAYDLAGDQAGAVMGIALALKMGANILVAPIAAAYAARLPRRAWLIALDLIRAGVLFCLPFVDAVWQIYLLIVLFQSAAAAFSATYMATVPDLLPGEAEYVRAIAKARIAYEAETLISPAIAAALLAFMGMREVFLGAVGGFALSALLLATVALPQGRTPPGGAVARSVAGVRRLLAAPQLRGALALNAAATLVGAMVAVNTVVLVRGVFDLGDRAAAVALATYGAGGVLAALAMPRLIAGGAERAVMLGAGVALAALLMSGALLPGYGALLALWAALGAATTLAQTPAAALIRRLGAATERQGLYAAHHAISHLMLLAAYLAAGLAGAEGGMVAAFLGLGAAAALAALVAALVWPREPSGGRRTRARPATTMPHETRSPTSTGARHGR